MVLRGLVIAWRLAGPPTRRSPVEVYATTEGVVREPSRLAITTGCPPSRTATTELVVPRSMPTILPMLDSVCWCSRPAVSGPQGRAAPRPIEAAALVKNRALADVEEVPCWRRVATDLPARRLTSWHEP